MCLAIVCIGAGIFVLKKNGETKNPLLVELEEDKKISGGNVPSGEKVEVGTILDKNNKMLSTWNTTEKAQNQLKILQASGETQE